MEHEKKKVLIGFGKYKGKCLETTIKTDPNWIKWAVSIGKLILPKWLKL